MNATHKDTFELLSQTRKNIIGICEAYSLEQLNRVPERLNNNLIWNAGHVVATMEQLTYALSGERTPSERAFIDRYRKGTRPEAPVDRAEVDFILNELAVGPGRLMADLEAGKLTRFQEYTTSFGVTLHNVEEAVVFNNLHETLHLGTMLALRRLVRPTSSR